ncbi:Hsp20/alpha crystallin family protein [uncultured Ruminococcus sp.]|uniref:Hsp20/alpha crystallin family protein n=1 Tax=uncultured Ruminococcus sp. TaxID=165186 RepID=UPI002619428D|nr:Hsp20/alpha crystallin family protein [uncultured Ruminococcus sp.]
MMTYLTPFERTGYDLFRSMRDWENEFFGGKSTQVSTCKTDIRDTGDSYVLEAELPGFQKEEIKIDVQGDVLTLSAMHKEKTEEEKNKEGTYLRRERSYCSYQQKLDISNVDASQLHAAYENGVLTLTMPKKQPAAPVSRQLEIH